MKNYFFLTTLCFIFVFLVACCEDEFAITSTPEFEDTLIVIEDDNSALTNQNSTSFQLTKNGAVYFQCDFGPYEFTLDSLLNNGNFNGNLQDSAFHLQYGINPNGSFAVYYDADKSKMVDLDSIDLIFTRSANNPQQFEIEHFMGYSVLDTIDYIAFNDTLNANQYPFYNAYKLSNCSFELELYFFNKYVGGCFHDEMVWFYYE